MNPRKYRVVFWRHMTANIGKVVEVAEVTVAFDAKDAADQVRIKDAAVYQGNDGYRCDVRSVEPAASAHGSDER